MSISIGIDIAKEKIDIYYNGQHAMIRNESKAIEGYFKRIDRSSQIVMESTGTYHRVAHRRLEEMGFAVMVVNPYQSKHFACAMKLLCKTDRVDAKMLSLFGQQMVFKATPSKTEEQEKRQDLSRHLDDLKGMKTDLEGRYREAPSHTKKSLQRLIDATNKEIKKVEDTLSKAIDCHQELKRKYEILCSVPGIGKTTAVYLLCCLSELGNASKREIAALAGLAPMNYDSGQFQGKRRIRGGRREIRSHLYMPILGAATKHNPQLKQFYDHLVKQGKPKKVALVACMRKLIIWLNAMLATNQMWCTNCKF